jgi:hypothetical protein
VLQLIVIFGKYMCAETGTVGTGNKNKQANEPGFRFIKTQQLQSISFIKTI